MALFSSEDPRTDARVASRRTGYDRLTFATAFDAVGCRTIPLLDAAAGRSRCWMICFGSRGENATPRRVRGPTTPRRRGRLFLFPHRPVRAPIVRVGRAAAPLRVVVFGVDGAPIASVALDLAALDAVVAAGCVGKHQPPLLGTNVLSAVRGGVVRAQAAGRRVELRGAPAFLGAPEVDVFFEVSRVRS